VVSGSVVVVVSGSVVVVVGGSVVVVVGGSVVVVVRGSVVVVVRGRVVVVVRGRVVVVVERRVVVVVRPCVVVVGDGGGGGGGRLAPGGSSGAINGRPKSVRTFEPFGPVNGSVPASGGRKRKPGGAVVAVAWGALVPLASLVLVCLPRDAGARVACAGWTSTVRAPPPSPITR
jgi:hypothetical protein